MRKKKREATGRANAGGSAGFRARRWTGRGRRARTRHVQAAVREAAVQPLPPGKLLRRGAGGEGSAELGREALGNRGEGTEKTRRVRVAHHRLTPHDADRLVHEQLRGPDRDGRNRAHDAAPDLGVHLPRDEGWTVTPSPRGVVRGKLRRPAPPYRSGTTTKIAAARSRARRGGDGRILCLSKASDATNPPKRARRTPRGERRNVPRRNSVRAQRATRARLARGRRASHLFIASRLRPPSRSTGSKS